MAHSYIPLRFGVDYASYLTPASAGGLGPENATEVIGIECDHHYGITTHDLVPGEDPAQTVYRLVRELWHPFRPEREINVLDDNHTWEVEYFNPKDDSRPQHTAPSGWGRVIIRKNEKAPLFINIFGAPSWMYDDGPGAVWFYQKFRAVTYGHKAAERAYDEAKIAQYTAEAERQKDTVRGRKAAKDARRMVWHYEADIRYHGGLWDKHAEKKAS
ncbi:hypothetical protein CcrColossus_gp175 [Caulobacter phage CcrColossus]|uniref:Uncharacterized protein n=1 Tax=Caulobacter phage CcrColossus TaxID=1211640 RepID=K4JUM3_9CAUD|nr:hypothetical protein CcrColossus_gp175 [Caulobacter phage CcrColossus]AFU88045.1 hypothetical protein CcrColossus_gp175 [Caulobacter phage CcrColossus]